MSRREIVIVVRRNTAAAAHMLGYKVHAKLQQRASDSAPQSIGYGDTVLEAIDDMWTCQRAATAKRLFEKALQP